MGPLEVVAASVNRACTDAPVSAQGDVAWRVDYPCEKLVLTLRLAQRCFISEVTLINWGASHVEVRGGEGEAVLWKDARRLVPKTELRGMWEHKEGKGGTEAVTLACPTSDDAALSYRCVLVGLYGQWEPPQRLGIKRLSVCGQPDDAPEPHPEFVPPTLAGPKVVNPHTQPARSVPLATTVAAPQREGTVSATSVLDPRLGAAPTQPAAVPPAVGRPPPSAAVVEAPATVPAPASVETAPLKRTAAGGGGNGDTETETESESDEAAPPAKRRRTDGGSWQPGAKPTAQQVPPGAPSPAASVPPLAGVTVCLSGFVNPERTTLRDIARRLGGGFTEGWTDATTHLVAAYPNTPKHRDALLSKRGHVVSKDWLYRADAEKQRPNENEYPLPKK